MSSFRQGQVGHQREHRDIVGQCTAVWSIKDAKERMILMSDKSQVMVYKCYKGHRPEVWLFKARKKMSGMAGGFIRLYSSSLHFQPL